MTESEFRIARIMRVAELAEHMVANVHKALSPGVTAIEVHLLAMANVRLLFEIKRVNAQRFRPEEAPSG